MIIPVLAVLLRVGIVIHTDIEINNYILFSFIFVLNIDRLALNIRADTYHCNCLVADSSQNN